MSELDALQIKPGVIDDRFLARSIYGGEPSTPGPKKISEAQIAEMVGRLFEFGGEAPEEKEQDGAALLAHLEEGELAELLDLVAELEGAEEAATALKSELEDRKGGEGSGHRGHAGIPGHQGGSLPGTGASWAHHGGERDPKEITETGIHVRRRMVQERKQIAGRIRTAERAKSLEVASMDKALDQCERDLKFAKAVQDTQGKGAAQQWYDKAEESLDIYLSRVVRVGEATKRVQDIKRERAASARKLLYKDAPADCEVNFGRLRKGKENVQEGFDEFRKLVGDNPNLSGQTVDVRRPTFYGKHRAYYDINTLHMPIEASTSVTIHELGHWLEDRDPGIHKAAVDFLERRTAGETARPLRELTGVSSYKDYEVAKKDKFRHPYAGKIYADGHATEIVSVGLEEMWRNPAMFAQRDPEYFDFIYDLTQKHSSVQSGPGW